MKEFLYASRWSAPNTHPFCLTELLVPRIIQASILYFQEMHLLFQRLVVSHPEQWEEVGKEYLLLCHTQVLFRIGKCV
jgi:hypothetical protein